MNYAIFFVEIKMYKMRKSYDKMESVRGITFAGFKIHCKTPKEIRMCQFCPQAQFLVDARDRT